MSAEAMSTITVGVWLEEEFNPEEGGAYTFNRALVEAIDRYEFTNANFVFLTTIDKNLKLSKPVIRLPIDAQHKAEKSERPSGRVSGKPAGLLKSLVPQPVRRLLKRLLKRNRPQPRPWQDLVEEVLAGLVRDRVIDVVYFPVWWRMVTNLDLERSSVPYVTNYWDLGHVSTYAFPEFSHSFTWNARETVVRRVFGKALLVFCESRAGLKEASAYLGLNPSRFAVVPFFIPKPVEECADASKEAAILSKLGLEPMNYFFYPAQFWPHKNHFGLLKAFSDVAEADRNVKLVLVGSDKGNLEYIKKIACSERLDESVVFAGFVEDEAVAALYRNALSLVMPTFLGPTNLPLLEAMEQGCPVICSDFDGHREMLGEAGIYVDPANHEALARAMISMLDASSRQHAKASVETRRGKHSFRVDEAMLAMDRAAAKLQAVRGCWQ